jgi:hypothetical protein
MTKNRFVINGQLFSMRPNVTLDWLKLKHPSKSVLKVSSRKPSLNALNGFIEDGSCPTTDGCRVECNGECEHGHPSWLKVLSMI